MTTTKKLVVLTTETKNDIQVNNQAHGVLARKGARMFRFIEDGAVETPIRLATPPKKRECPEQKWQTLSETKHGRVSANAFGVAMFVYLRHDEYDTRSELTERLEDEVDALTRLLRKQRTLKIAAR